MGSYEAMFGIDTDEFMLDIYIVAIVVGGPVFELIVRLVRGHFDVRHLSKVLRANVH